jgi:Trk K+ transport system NAD-binding subunit
MTFNPHPNTIIEPNCVLITLGERPAIDKLEKIAGGFRK